AAHRQRVAEEDLSLTPLVDRLQSVLGERLERLVVFDGALVGVVDRLDDELVAAARLEADASGMDVPVELVDGRNWEALSRLGERSPFVGARPLLEAAPTAEPRERPGERLSVRGRRQLDAARLLADQGHGIEAVRLATDAMLCAIAGGAGLETLPDHHDVALWLYGEMVPSGRLMADDAARVGRALALVGVEALPDGLIQEVLVDAATLLDPSVRGQQTLPLPLASTAD
ncbi:MAG: hypothetical protein AAGE94_21540, partial [Acidobacteriota bacterium]